MLEHYSVKRGWKQTEYSAPSKTVSRLASSHVPLRCHRSLLPRIYGVTVLWRHRFDQLGWRGIDRASMPLDRLADLPEHLRVILRPIESLTGIFTQVK